MDSIYFLFSVLFIYNGINTLPIDNSNHVRIHQSPVTPPEILNFMRRFGYLETGTSTSEALYHEDAVIVAIKNVQKYGALNETGILDNDTLKLMSSPRCGVPDLTKKLKRSKRYIIGSGGWQKRRITYFIANWSPKVGEDKVAEGMRKAFDLWSKYSNLKFYRVFDPDADIIVAFGSGYHGDRFPFDGPGSVLAHAFYPYEMYAFGGDIHFDDDENWKENATHLSEGVDFTSVAIHELGHSLGLAHSPVFSSIMFPYYKGPIESRDLNYDDVMAMYELYIRNVLEEDRINMEPATTEIIEVTEDEEFSESDSNETTHPPLKNPVQTTSKPEKSEETTSQSGTTFIGDSETVPKHKQRFSFPSIVPTTRMTTTTTTSTTTTTIKPAPIVPEVCFTDLGFDAVALLRGEIFIFKNEYVWRLDERYRIQSGYPILFREIFVNLDPEVKKIDAIYERSDSAIVIFSGNQYWVFDGDYFIENSPRPIGDYGFENVTKIDAAMVWSKNDRTYLFSGNKFIRYNDETKDIDPNYPALISDKWHGIPNNIDAVTSVANGKTYFFKGNLYWLYDNYRIRPRRGYPRRAATVWMGCPLHLHT